MDTRAEALRERLARLEVLIGGPITAGDGRTICDQLQSLHEGLRGLSARVDDQPESSAVQGDTAEMLEHLRAAFEAMHAAVALLKQVVVM